MKTVKKLLLASLFICIYSSKIFAEKNQSWWQRFLEMFISLEDNHYQEKPSNVNHGKKEVDYGHVRQEFRSTFDNIFATSYQTQATQNELKKVREKSSNEVIHCLQTQFGNLSEPQAKHKARELAWSVAVEFISEKIVQIANDEISRIRRNPPINPEYLQSVDQHYLTQNIKQEILYEIQISMNNKYGSLRYYIGEPLFSKVSFKVEQALGIYDKPAQSIDYNQDPYAHLPEHQKPSAPPVDQSIYQGIIEIYPKNIGAPMKVFRDEICCSCQVEFSEIGKRVILQCGHTICPACAYQWFYSYKKNTCPHCRANISQADFPSDYLHQYM